MMAAGNLHFSTAMDHSSDVVQNSEQGQAGKALMLTSTPMPYANKVRLGKVCAFIAADQLMRQRKMRSGVRLRQKRAPERAFAWCQALLQLATSWQLTMGL